MGLVEAALLFFIMLTLALIPSASVALVITRSATHGVSNGVAVSIGIVLGDLTFIFLVIFGLTYIAETMGWLFLIMRYLGAAYLVWLGYTLFISGNETTISLGKDNQKGSIVTSFVSGYLLTLGDIKAIFFYISLLPVFIDLQALKLEEILILTLVTIVAVGGAKIFYAISTRKIVSKFTKHELVNNVKKTAGAFMVGAGGYLILKP